MMFDDDDFASMELAQWTLEDDEGQVQMTAVEIVLLIVPVIKAAAVAAAQKPVQVKADAHYNY